MSHRPGRLALFGGQQHPGPDALEIAKPFLASGGRDSYIYLTDGYRNFRYERTTYAQHQGYLKTEVEQASASPYRNRITWCRTTSRTATGTSTRPGTS